MKNMKFNKEEFLNTPEHFNQVVEQCVKEQLESEKGVISVKQYKSKRMKFGSEFVKVAVAVFVLSVVLGGGVLAARCYMLSKIVKEDVGPNDVAVDDKIQNIEGKQNVSNNLPGKLDELRPDLKENLVDDALITIKEAYFDGSKLYVYSEATDYGEQFVGNMGADHFYINGELRAGGLYVLGPKADFDFETAKNTVFYSELQLADMMLMEDFTVEILCVAFSADGERIISNVTFNVEVRDTSSVIESNRIELEDGYVEIYSCSVSNTTTYINYAYYFSGENAKEHAENLAFSMITIEDDLGNKSDALYDMNSPNGIRVSEPIQTEDGSWYVEHEFYVKGMSTEATAMTIIPYYYNPQEEKTSKGEALDYGIFTIVHN